MVGKVGPTPGTLETTSNLRDPAEALRTPRISLEPPLDHWYSIPRDVMHEKGFSVIISFLHLTLSCVMLNSVHTATS